MGDRLTVGLQTLTLPIGVRIPVPQPFTHLVVLLPPSIFSHPQRARRAKCLFHHPPVTFTYAKTGTISGAEYLTDLKILIGKTKLRYSLRTHLMSVAKSKARLLAGRIQGLF